MTATTEAEFSARAERHRRELHVHCYRMMGNFEEAEDLVQETLLRAWRNRSELSRDDWFRAWLYKIATNACLDAIKLRKRRVPSLASFAEISVAAALPGHAAARRGGAGRGAVRARDDRARRSSP